MFKYTSNPKLESLLLYDLDIPKQEFNYEWIMEHSPNIRKEIMFFIKTVLSAFPDIDLSIFYNNLSTLKFGKIEEYSSSLSIYDFEDNKIKCKLSSPDSIDFALLSASSTVFSDRITRSGFSLRRTNHFPKINIGIAFDIGYTAFLDEMLFGHRTLPVENEKYLVSNIYRVLGDKMRHYYFEADFNGFISSLEAFCSRNDILDFLQKTDFIYKKFQFGRLPLLYRKEALELYYECIVFTIGNIIVKLMRDLESGQISVYQAQLRLNQIIKNIPEYLIEWMKLNPIPHIDDLKANVPNITHINKDDIARYKLKI